MKMNATKYKVKSLPGKWIILARVRGDSNPMQPRNQTIKLHPYQLLSRDALTNRFGEIVDFVKVFMVVTRA